MTWQIESFTDVGGNKDQEFVRFIDLPSKTSQPFELAINGPQTLLREHGWDTVRRHGRLAHALGLSRVHPALEGGVRRRQAHLRRDAVGLVQRSHRVLSRRRDGRRSCRTPAGRAHLPSGEGLLAFSTPDEALAGIDAINSDYARHAQARRRDRARAFRRRPRPAEAPRAVWRAR